MGQASHHPDAPTLGLMARAAFTALPLAALLAVLSLLLHTALPLAGSLDWVPALGIRLAWRIDGLAALMLLMVTGVGTAVFVYAGGYMAGDPGQRRLYVLLTLFMLAMIGCVTADDLFSLFLFWEATSVLSFLLVGFDHTQTGSRKSAQQALLVTGTGGLALLAGLILLSQAVGTTSIGTLVERLPATPASPVLTAGVLLVLAGAFTKSAQFPFHFWLPNAMAAPTPVSAYLHSATMVKLGVYLMARLDAGLDTWPMWQVLLQGAGSITAAWAMVLALRERDLKRILAWSTVATLGTLVALVGMPGEGAAVAVGALLLAHALYKAPLFFVAGNIDHATGTRLIDRLGHLRRAMPWTALCAALAGMSMAGIPLSFGYVVKALIANAKATGDVLPFVPLANTVFSAIAVAVAGVAAVRVFWHEASERPPDTGLDTSPDAPGRLDGGPALVLPPLALALCGVVLGLFPMWAQPMLQAAGVAMTPGDEPVLAQLAEVLGPELSSFAVTFGLGATVFLLWEPLHRVVAAGSTRLAVFGFAAHYERSLGWIPRIAAVTTRTLQHGRSPGYMFLAATAAVVAVGPPLLASLPAQSWPAWSAPSVGVSGAVLLMTLGCLAAASLRQRLVLLLGTGLVGYGSAVLFLFAGAPDVAFTQVVVETVFVIVVAAVLLALQRQGKADSVAEPAWRPLALVLSLTFATVLTALMLLTVATPFDDTVSRWFGAESVPAAHGRNVVNVILVDFRALDTLGEITVVMLSLLAAIPLLRASRSSREPGDTP
ncbi:hydrogen gas-evolving membrane-bound hydrogenase subunit E [Aquabacterium sp.]|uniref:hydrogen gas-evolving membrane-bound hydrogenase subunit E n=1 Tax=Aquabacterium sp. TaxID=1872578 RepID=UPI0035C7122D